MPAQRIVWTSLFILTLSLIPARAEEPRPSPAAAPAAAAPPAAPGDLQVDRVLGELEKAGAAVNSIRCKVAYAVKDMLNVTESTRRGEILFRRAEPHPIFLVQFDELNTEGTVYKEKEWWLLRNRWLIEAKAKSKSIIEREIAAPGETIDLFNLEKSPVPIPFGQKRDEILANFDVQLVPLQLGDPAESEHLYCKPKASSSLAEEFSRLDYYVSKKQHLPLRIVANDAAGNKVTTADFDLESGKINADLPDDAFKLPESETKGFNVSKEPLKQTE